MLLERAANRWWTLVVRGILSIAFGILAVIRPGTAVMALVIVFGIYAIAEGIAALSMFLSPLAEGSGLVGLSGVISIAAGLIALLWPGITAVALFYVIAFWAIVDGVIDLVVAFRAKSRDEHEWTFAVSGLLLIAFGVIILGWPGIGVVAVLALIATAAILRGAMLLIAGVRLRGLRPALGAGSQVTRS